MNFHVQVTMSVPGAALHMLAKPGGICRIRVTGLNAPLSNALVPAWRLI